MKRRFLSFSGAVRQREQWLSSRKPEETREAYVAVAGAFSSELKIVTGEANGKLFDRPDFASAIQRVFQNKPEAVFKLVFHKSDTEAEARVNFQRENPHFFALKEQYPERVHIYWTPLRPRQHYAVVDSQVVILEQPDHVSLKPFWATIIHDSEISSLWEERFDTYCTHLTEMRF